MNQRNRKQFLIFAALLAFIMVMTISGAAQAPKDTLRNMTQGETFSGSCCKAWSDSIELAQAEKPRPIIVTWSTDYRSTGPMLVGLRINNSPCTFYGSAFLAAAAPDNNMYASASFQWVIMPGDYGLVRGKNTIRVCGGGVGAEDSISLGYYTLTARLDRKATR